MQRIGEICDIKLHWDGAHERMYAFVDEIKPADVVFGIIMLFMAFLGILLRFSLAQFRKNSSKWLCDYFSETLLLVICYYAYLSVVFRENLFQGKLLIRLLIGLVFVILNYVYFNKRKDLFEY